jgi:hypothetical protein
MYGEISAKAGRRHGVGPKGTRVNPRFHTQEEDFEGKEGLEDQGRSRDTGPVVAGDEHIDKVQGMGTPARASGKPTRGGSAGPQKQPTRKRHIDDPALTQPEFREGGNSPAVRRGQWSTSIPGGGKPSPGGASVGRPSSRGAPPAQRPGRPGGYASAASRRP